MIRRRGTLFVVSAPSGAGKTTLCRELRERVGDLAYSVSYTTRAPRPGEQDGVDFWFVREDRFRELLGGHEFAEWATVHGNLYGTRASALEAALAEGHDVLLDIDTQGAAQLRGQQPVSESLRADDDQAARRQAGQGLVGPGFGGEWSPLGASC